MESRAVRIGLRIATVLIVAFIWLPLVVIGLYAFNDSRTQAWPLRGLTLQWFADTLASESVRTAFLTSLLAASGATLVALLLGSLAAFAVQRYRFFGRETITFLVILPIALPGVVTGMALNATFRTVGLDLGLFTVIVGHATFCVVLCYNNVIARLRRTPRSLEEASADLGSDTWHTFRRVTLPAIRTALISGGLLAFALSFDEVIVTSFTAGAGTQTLPLWILAAIKRPNELPVVNVVGLFLIVLSIVPVYLAQRIGGEATAIR